MSAVTTTSLVSSSSLGYYIACYPTQLTLLPFVHAKMAGVSPTTPSPSSSFPIVQRSSAPASTTLVTPPELEQTLNMFSSHRTVLGYILLSCGTPASIIRHSGVVFEGEQGKKYASAVAKIVEAVRGGLEEVGADGADADEVRFMRIRTRRHELMITPDKHYILAVLHDPAS